MVAFLAFGPTSQADAASNSCDQATAPRLCLIHWHVHRTNVHRAKLNQPAHRYHWAAERYPARRDRILASWMALDATWRHHYTQARGSFTVAIGYVFGPYAGQARAVCGCEGCSVTSTNGQYLGGFQMGTHERATYATTGYRNALQQTWAAWRYFVASGRDWSPWSCQP